MYYICAFSLSSQVETEGRKCLVNLNYLAVNMLTWIQPHHRVALAS